MKKTFLKLSVIGVTCSMLWASAQPRPEPQSDEPGGKGSSSKRLSATGRATEHPMFRVSKLIGAQVNDSSHTRAGQIQDIIVNPNSGKIDFALLSTNAAGSAASDSKLVPVPWSLLKTTDTSQYAASSEHPVFTLNIDQSKLTNAPTADGAELNQSGWRQRVYSYYGLTPESSKGGAESPQGTNKGEGTRQLPESPPAPQQPHQ